MKLSFSVLAIFLSLMLLCSCAGGAPAPQIPEPGEEAADVPEETVPEETQIAEKYVYYHYSQILEDMVGQVSPLSDEGSDFHYLVSEEELPVYEHGEALIGGVLKDLYVYGPHECPTVDQSLGLTSNVCDIWYLLEDDSPVLDADRASALAAAG